jgi:hypothetical protein
MARNFEKRDSTPAFPSPFHAAVIRGYDCCFGFGGCGYGFGWLWQVLVIFRMWLFVFFTTFSSQLGVHRFHMQLGIPSLGLGSSRAT